MYSTIPEARSKRALFRHWKSSSCHRYSRCGANRCRRRRRSSANVFPFRCGIFFATLSAGSTSFDSRGVSLAGEAGQNRHPALYGSSSGPRLPQRERAERDIGGSEGHLLARSHALEWHLCVVCTYPAPGPLSRGAQRHRKQSGRPALLA